MTADWKLRPEIITNGYYFPSMHRVSDVKQQSEGNKMYGINSNPTEQTILLIFGFVRRHTTKKGMKKCMQQIFPEDIINLILKWNGKTFYLDRKPYNHEFKIWVC